ncbi:hypothetical protein MMPV_004057 [Pyropia vietnamensis]
MGIRPPDEDDLYGLLGIERDASPSAIKSAYYRQSQKYHPDKHRGTSAVAAATASFTRVKDAYEVLSHPVLRRVYDSLGMAAVRTAQEPSTALTTYESFARDYTAATEAANDGVDASFAVRNAVEAAFDATGLVVALQDEVARGWRLAVAGWRAGKGVSAIGTAAAGVDEDDDPYAMYEDLADGVPPLSLQRTVLRTSGTAFLSASDSVHVAVEVGSAAAGRSPASGGTLELMGVHAFGAATTGEAWAVVPADPAAATVVGGRMRRELTDADALSLDVSAGTTGLVPRPSTLGLGLTADRQLTPRCLASLCLRAGRGAGVSLSVDRGEMEVEPSDTGSSDEEDDDDSGVEGASDDDEDADGSDTADADPMDGASSSDSDSDVSRATRQRRRRRRRQRQRRQAGSPPDPAMAAVMVKPWARLSALDKVARLAFMPLTVALSPTVWAPVSVSAGTSLGASGAEARLTLRRPVGAGAPFFVSPSPAVASAAASASAARRRAAAAATARAHRRALSRAPGSPGPYVEASASLGLSSGSWALEGGGGRRWASATTTGMSLRYASDGLSLRLGVSRGGHTLSVPLLLAGGGVADVAAAMAAAVATAAMAAVIEVGVIAPLRAALAASAAATARHHRRAAAAAERAEAANVTELLAEAVAASERREAAALGGGLIIERAVYGARAAVEAETRDGPRVEGVAAEEERELIEVRDAIQALVEASVVQVAAASKTDLMGVWDPTVGGAATPKSLRVWYRFRGRPHVCTVKDGGVLEMPLSKHLLLELEEAAVDGGSGR